MTRWEWCWVVLALSSCSFDYEKDKATPADQVPQMVFQNLKQTGVKDGRRVYSMETEGSEVFSTKKQMRLKSFRFQEYDSMGQVVSNGEAESATIDTGSNDATLTGRLVARSEEQGVTLTIDGGNQGGVSWANDDRVLRTRPGTVVSMTKDDGSRVDAKALTLDLGSNRLDLEEGIQGTWTPETKQDAPTTTPAVPSPSPLPPPSPR